MTDADNLSSAIGPNSVMPPDLDDAERSEWRANRQVADAARAGRHDERFEPPPDLWARIDSAVESAETPVATATAPRRPRTARLVAVAAAVAAVMLVGVGSLVVATRERASDEVVARVTLDRLPGIEQGEGNAKIVSNDGGLRLVVDVADLTAADGYYEVWLIDKNVDKMVSLGPLRADGRYVVPPGVDPGSFPVVDISEEPSDGNPTHSGVSVLRGVLAV